MEGLGIGHEPLLDVGIRARHDQAIHELRPAAGEDLLSLLVAGRAVAIDANQEEIGHRPLDSTIQQYALRLEHRLDGAGVTTSTRPHIMANRAAGLASHAAEQRQQEPLVGKVLDEDVDDDGAGHSINPRMIRLSKRPSSEQFVSARVTADGFCQGVGEGSHRANARQGLDGVEQVALSRGVGAEQNGQARQIDLHVGEGLEAAHMEPFERSS